MPYIADPWPMISLKRYISDAKTASNYEKYKEKGFEMIKS